MNGLPETPHCPVCGGPCVTLGEVDFNKSCEEARGSRLPPSGRMVRYVICGSCGFSFAPEFAGWTPVDFEREIYNGQYSRVDPDYADVRPRVNAATLLDTFGAGRRPKAHLDFGGGAGLLSKKLRQAHWKSRSHDPFVDRDVRLEDLGRFQLITCFEVFEHVADVQQLARDLASLLAADGLLLVSTLVSDGQLVPSQPPAWWYAAPRNGHISLFSSRSLSLLAQQHGFSLASFSPNLHLFWRGQFPAWASHLLKAG